MKPASLRALAARLLVAASVTTSCALALADTTPLRILVGFPAGGSTDLIARQLAAGLQTELARPVVVENRAGAGGQIAAQALKAARPDGHTLFLSNGHTVSIVPVTMANPGFDVAKDFAPVGLVTSNPDVFAVNPAVVGAGVTDIRGFAAWARAHAGKNSVGVPAPGSGPEFAVGVLGRALATPMTAVPYRGDGPLVQDLVAGQVPAGIGGVGAILPYVESGKLRLLAVNGPARIARLPEVPTYAEAGIAGLEEMMFTAVFAPAGTPDALLRQYNAAIVRVVNAPAFAQRIASLGVTAATSTPEALGQRVESGRAAYGQLVKTLDYKLQ